MKKGLFSKALKIFYLGCLIAIILTPNVIGSQLSDTYEATKWSLAEEKKESELDPCFEQLGERMIKEHKGLTSLIVMKDGQVYLEEYYNGSDASSTFEIHSCTKTVIAILTGIAVDQGYIQDENSTFLDLFQGFEGLEATEGFENILLKDMLSMSSGIYWDKYAGLLENKINVILNGDEQGLRQLTKAPIASLPGEVFNYDSNESRALMAMVAYNCGMEDVSLAEEYLFSKLHISDYIWPYNDTGLVRGGRDIYCSARDLAKIGQLLLQEGSYEGNQIVSKEWVKKMFTVRMEDVEAEDIEPPDKLDYCFYIWHMVHEGQDIYFAYGRGGQYIFMVPEKQIVVVTSSIDKERTDNYREILYEVIEIFGEENK